MGLQIIIKNTNVDNISIVFDEIYKSIEVFNIDNKLFGISIPTNIIDQLGEDKIFNLLDNFCYYFLWDGNWYNT